MTPLLLWDYHGHPYELTSPEDAGRRFDEQIETIMPHGGCGQTMTIGTADQPTLRIDIDVDADRAAVRWLPDGSYAIALEPSNPIIVYESPDAGLQDVPAEVARLNTAAARQVVVEYAATGRRPTRVAWSEPESVVAR